MGGSEGSSKETETLARTESLVLHNLDDSDHVARGIQDVEARRATGKDVSLIVATRAEVLLETVGALGACLADCEEVLNTNVSKPRAKIRVLPIRALIFTFLAVDDLALHDLQEFDQLKNEYPDIVADEEERRQDINARGMERSDCPAAFVCGAADWHRARRFAMLRRYPELKLEYDTKLDIKLTCVLLMVLVIIHVFCTGLSSLSWSATLVLAPTVGAVCAYGFQALTHELGHMAYNCNGGVKNNWGAFVIAAIASSFCNFPWHFYYWNYHNRHHAHAGGERDRDGDILFRAWHQPPTLARGKIFYDIGGTSVSRFLWTGFFAVLVYPMFCRAKWLLDASHVPSISYEGWNVATHLLVTYFFGLRGLVYVILSAAFSLGAFGHPFIQFWLTQHAFVIDRKPRHPRLAEIAETYYVPLLQPTCSSSQSSALWHALNFGELRHVEHHDFPLIPYLRAFRLPSKCPEFYSSLQPALTPFGALQDWLLHSGHKQHIWMRDKGDFAGRSYYLGRLWRLMSEMDDDDGDEDEEVDQTRQPWSPSEDVDDEDAFVHRPVNGDTKL